MSRKFCTYLSVEFAFPLDVISTVYSTGVALLILVFSAGLLPSQTILTETITVTQTSVGLIGEDRNNFNPAQQSEGYLNNLQVPDLPTCPCPGQTASLTDVNMSITLHSINIPVALPPLCSFNSVFGNIYVEGAVPLNLTAEDAINYDLLSAPGCGGFGSGMNSPGSVSINLMTGCGAGISPLDWLGVDIIPAINWGPTTPACASVNGNGISGGHLTVDYTVVLTASYLCNCPLPVNNLKITAEALPDFNQIECAIPDLHPDELTILERAEDPTQWTEIKTFSFSEDSQDGQYFQHKDFVAGNLSYYRCKSSVENGEWSYSKVVKVTRENELSTKFFPNPVSDRCRLELSTFQPNTPLEVSFWDVNGRNVLNYKKSSISTSHISLDLHRLNRGMFFVHVLHGDASTIQKLVKY